MILLEKSFFETRNMEITIPTNAIVNINKGVTAFIRTKYDDILFDRLTSNQAKSLLNTHDFRQLQSDVFFLANNLNDYSKNWNLGKYLLFVLKYFNDNSIPFDSGIYCDIFSNLEKASPIIGKLGEEYSNVQDRLVNELIENLLHRLDVEHSFKNSDIFSPLKDLSTQSSFDKELLRKILLSKSISNGNKAYIDRARKIFNEENDTSTDPKLQPVILKGYLKSGNNPKENLQNLIKEFSTIDMNLQSKSENYRRAIVGQVSNPELMDEIINNYIFNKKLMGTSERAYSLMLVPACLGNNKNFDNYFNNYFLPNFMKITEEFRSTQFLFKSMINCTVSLICDSEQLEQFERIIKENDIKECPNAIKQACEDARNNILIIENDGDEIRKSLS